MATGVHIGFMQTRCQFWAEMMIVLTIKPEAR